MAKDPAFLFYPGDYLRDTQTLSSNSQVAYDRIMCEHMRNICISQQQLKFFTKRLSPDELDEIMFVLSESDGGYQIEWIAESINKRRAYSESRRNNRKGKKSNNTSKTYDEHMENENEDVIDYKNIVANYHLYCEKLSKVAKISDSRKKHINGRFKDYGVDVIIDVLKKAGNSKFLNGDNNRRWKADFDWILNPNNFIKILEGKYEDKSETSNGKPKLAI